MPWVEDDNTIIEVNSDFSHLEDPRMFPIAIALPETLMGPLSFRGAVFEFQPKTELKDLAPYPDDTKISSDTTKWRQKSSDRTSLYNDFFNASDKAFDDASSNWALSADVTGSRVFLGYIWGVFIPVGEYHRFFKIGYGPTVYYTDLSVKLNLCSQYKITVSEDGEKSNGGECIGKTEIDSSSESRWGISTNLYFTVWERITKDSVWKIVSWTQGEAKNDLKLKNHNNLEYEINSGTEIFISYTYRL